VLATCFASFWPLRVDRCGTEAALAAAATVASMEAAGGDNSGFDSGGVSGLGVCVVTDPLADGVFVFH